MPRRLREQARSHRGMCCRLDQCRIRYRALRRCRLRLNPSDTKQGLLHDVLISPLSAGRQSRSVPRVLGRKRFRRTA
ncbi:hypothetical protein EGJ53_00970 [Pseudomonas fluorescens]|nr:hypothetical protein EGJ53_00970 [Pseudomonas fluorescens]